ncbi:UV DNA damage repair endonuclease UvsE [Trichococcus alkaliphilus]|uniref:UV DNA damage repair endonuclease UvsE n=1 Tax=Trichococcus alkaliphilus TaxID=2052943 RepID=UPI000D0B1D8C|nr:UV DNA damage repair endonuclease UvsE [Trichococcus alkaliphilus]
MSIGYACLNIGTPNTNIRSVMQRNATPEKLTEVTAHNLEALSKMVDYNIANDIRLYRISSDLIPFGSSPVNTLDWPEIHKEAFERIGAKIRKSNMRVSLHPGQYTVLNSPTEDVVERAIEDLIYHDKILTALGTDTINKIILHVGGIYGDKEAALNRFAENFQRLLESVQKRLIIENDDRLYNIEEVLGLANRLQIPAVYDNMHHAINPPPSGGNDQYWIAEANKTWKEADGNQKIHYSQETTGKLPGAHTDTTNLETFLQFYGQLDDPTIDIMLEVKDKNLSAIKCQNAITENKRMTLLEKEWGRYKYTILEKSAADYQAIRTLLKDKSAYPVQEFYRIVEDALAKETKPGAAENAAQHVWGYFKNKATPQERKDFEKNMENYRNGTGSLATVKRQLYKLATKYEEKYLIQSLYFYI